MLRIKAQKPRTANTYQNVPYNRSNLIKVSLILRTLANNKVMIIGINAITNIHIRLSKIPIGFIPNKPNKMPKKTPDKTFAEYKAKSFCIPKTPYS